jgi:phage terminase small subunit
VVKTFVLRLSSDDAENYESTLDELEERLEEDDIGEVTATMDMGTEEVVVFIDLLSDSDKPRLVKLITELGLRGIARLEKAEETDDEGWEDDDSDEWDDDDEEEEDEEELIDSDDDDNEEEVDWEDDDDEDEE